MGKALISVISTNVYGLLNSMWCSARRFGFVPSRVHILSSEEGLETHAMLREMASIVLEEHGAEAPHIESHRFDSGDLSGLASLVSSIIDDEVSRGNSFAIDATPGKKNEMIACLARSLGHPGCEHVFYSELSSYENTRKPFILIPCQFITPYDIKREARGR